MAIKHTHAPEPPGLPPGVPIDPAQESLVRALRASFNILRVLMIVLVVLYLCSGVFRVEPGQQGLVARLGKLRENSGEGGGYVFQPGWYFSMLPEPFDKKFVLTGQVQSLVITTFMFNSDKAATAKNLADILTPKEELQPGVDGAMFTGDRNLSHGRWEVQYKIEDAAQFVQNVGATPDDAQPLLQRLAETAVVEEVGGRTVEEVTRTALDNVRDDVQTRLQKALSDLATGIKVVQVLASTIEPGAVRDAFLDVSRAEQERLALEREADEKATETLNRAAGDQYAQLLQAIQGYGAAQLSGSDEATRNQRLAAVDARLTEAEAKEAGQVAVRLRDARAEANEVRERLRGEYEEFCRYVEQRTARPRITMLGLGTQMRGEILGNVANEIFFVPQHSDQIEIVINRDQERLRALDEQRTLQRQRKAAGLPP